MSLSHCILGFLSYGSMSGYDLTKAFGSSVKFFWYVQTEKPNKKNYSITEEGKTEFLHCLCSEDSDVSKKNKDAFLMKVFFSGAKTTQQSDVLPNGRSCYEDFSIKW